MRQDEQSLLAAEHARRQAIERGEIGLLETMVAAPFHYAHITGLIEDRADYFRRMRADPHFIKATSAHDLVATMRPGYALLTGRSHIEIDLELPMPVTETHFLAVWEWQEGRWKILAYASSPLAAA